MPPDSTTATKSRIWLSRMVITILYRADDLVILPARDAPCLYLRPRGRQFFGIRSPPESGRPVRNRAASRRTGPLMRSDFILLDKEVSNHEKHARCTAILGGRSCCFVLFPS